MSLFDKYEIDWYAVGILATFAIGVWNVINTWRVSKKTAFINTVTSERVKWIDKVRQNISSFCGLSHHWALTQDITQGKRQEILEQLDKLRWEIKLQLNPKEPIYSAIAEQIDKIPDLSSFEKQEELKKAITELIKISQALLKDEWEKVKEESVSGNLEKKKWWQRICKSRKPVAADNNGGKG